MKSDTTITITPSQVEAWEKEAQEIERQAGLLTQRANALRAKAKAAAFLLGLGGNPEEDQGPITQRQPVLRDLGLPEAQSPGNMTEAMAALANASAEPMTKAAMKLKLTSLGFSAERMGNYFYTCVMRLKNSKRITVTPDGKIWRAGA